MGQRGEIGVLPRRSWSRQKKLIHVTVREVVHVDLFVGSSSEGNRTVSLIRQRAFRLLRQIGTRPLNVVGRGELDDVIVGSNVINPQFFGAGDDHRADGPSRVLGRGHHLGQGRQIFIGPTGVVVVKLVEVATKGNVK